MKPLRHRATIPDGRQVVEKPDERLQVLRWGEVPYGEALARQREIQVQIVGE